MNAATDPGTLSLRLYGVPDPDPRRTIDTLTSQRRLAGITYEVAEGGDGEIAVTVYGADTRALRENVSLAFTNQHGHAVYSTDGWTLDAILAQRLNGLCLVIADSCTPGLVLARAANMTNPSSSVIADLANYSTDANPAALGALPATIARYGMVSPHTAEDMARNALAVEGLRPDLALAITAYAGPGGGTEAAPAATVCVCAMRPELDAGRRPDGRTRSYQRTYQVNLPGDPDEIRTRTTTLALHALRGLLVGERPPVARQVDT
jgi:nicotinamide-nucleotide amidase